MKALTNITTPIRNNYKHELNETKEVEQIEVNIHQ